MKHLLCLIFLFNYSFAKPNTVNEIDSLIQFTQQHSTKITIPAYLKLSDLLINKNPSKSIYYSKKGTQIARLANDKVAEGIFNRTIGLGHYFLGNYDSAAVYYFESIRLLESIQDYKNLAKSYEILARLHRKTRALKQAHIYYNKASDIYTKTQDSIGISTIMNEWGVVYEYEQKFEEAFKRYNTSLIISKKLKDTVAITYALSNLGTLFIVQQKYYTAEKYLHQVLAIRKNLNDTFTLSLTYADLGLLYIKWNKLNEAISYFEKSNVLANTLQYNEMLSNNYLKLSEISELNGNYVDAYKYHLLHTTLKDSLFNEQKSNQIAELETKYESEKKDLEINSQSIEIKRKQGQLIFSFVFIIAIIIIAILLYNRYRLKQQSLFNITLLKQQNIRNKAIIEAEEKERIRIARELHDGIGQQLSAAKMNLSAFENKVNQTDKNTYKQVIKLVDDAIKEIRNISHNMMPNALINLGLASATRDFISKINVNDLLKIELQIVGLKERLPATTETVLYRVLQECVSNIIKHAQASHINIQLIQHDTHLNLLIEDNGIGFNTLNINQAEGIGLKNMISRVKFLNGHIDFDSAIGKGTTVIIDIPIS